MAIIHANLVPLSILLKEASLKSYAQIATRPTTHPNSPLVQQTTNHQIKKHQSSLHHLANMAKFKPEEMEKMNTTRQQPGTMPNFSTFIMETKEKSMENDNKLFPISRMIYTDGSGYKGAIGAVAVAFANSTKIAELQSQLGPDTRHTVFEGELVVIKLAGGLLFFLPLPYLVAVFSLLYTTLLYFWVIFPLLYITLHYWGHYSLLCSTFVRFMVAGGDLFVTPPLWHPASVAVQSLS